MPVWCGEKLVCGQGGVRKIGCGETKPCICITAFVLIICMLLIFFRKHVLRNCENHSQSPG